MSERSSFLVPFVSVREQLLQRLPWRSLSLLLALGLLNLALWSSGWQPECLQGGSSGHMLFVATLLCAFLLLVPQGVPADLMLLFLGASCCLFGILSSKLLFKGCASDAVITLALLFPIMRAMSDTGVPERFINLVLGSAKGTCDLILRMFAAVAMLSGLFNNTPIVVMMIPLLQSLCVRQGVPPQAVLMPLSFAAQAGGGLTKMGSSINFVADEVFGEAGFQIGFFTLSTGCVFICLLGAVYCAVMGPRLLRGREEPPAVSTEAHFQVAFRLSEPSPLLGASLDDLGLHRFRGVHWLRLRSEELGPPEQRLQATDLIEVSCTCEAVVQLRHVRGLELSNDDEISALGSWRRRRCLCEAAVKDSLHETVIDSRHWKRQLQCAVLAVRGGETRVNGFHGYELHAGDVLLIEAFGDMLGSQAWAEHFGVVRRLPNSAPPRRGRQADLLRALVIVSGLGVMIVVASCKGPNLPSLPVMALLFLCCIVAIKGLRLPEVYAEINGQVLLTIVGALALGEAMASSHLADCAAEGLVEVTRPWGAGAVKLSIYAATIGLGQFLNSAANVAIMGKIAVPIASSMGIAVGEMALIVTYAASACYTAPYGYQTNTLMLDAGGYVWADFLKFGGGLQVLHMFLVVALAPLCAQT